MISEKAYIAPGAKIGKNVTIYPFAYIEDDVVIGDDCVIYPYVSIMRGTTMGRGNKVYQNTVLGAEPQDFNHKGEATRLVIGDENIFRENVVVNRATFTDGETRIGNRNFFMEGVHISHDTKVDDYITFGYGTKVAGDCEVHLTHIHISETTRLISNSYAVFILKKKKSNRADCSKTVSHNKTVLDLVSRRKPE